MLLITLRKSGVESRARVILLTVGASNNGLYKWWRRELRKINPRYEDHRSVKPVILIHGYRVPPAGKSSFARWSMPAIERIDSGTYQLKGYLKSFLFGVRPFDVFTYAVLACYLPGASCDVDRSSHRLDA